MWYLKGKHYSSTSEESARLISEAAYSGATSATSSESYSASRVTWVLLLPEGMKNSIIQNAHCCINITQHCSHPSLLNKPMMRVEGACASGGLAFSCAVDAIRAGADVVLVAGVEVQTTADSRTGADFLARASHYATQRPIHDFVFPALFARRSAAYKRKHGATEEDIGRAAVKAYANAARNPLAHMRSKSMLLTTAASPSEGNPLFLHDFEDVGHMKVNIFTESPWSKLPVLIGFVFGIVFRCCHAHSLV